MKKSSAGEFFRLIQEELGDCTDFILFHQATDDAKRENFIYSHTQHDGFTALLDLLEKKNLKVPENLARMSQVQISPKWLVFWRFLLKSLHLSIRSQKFSGFNPKALNSATEIPPAHFSQTLTLEESARIDLFCKNHKIAPMAFLLYHLDLQVAKLTEGEGSRFWMVPISLRSSIEPDPNAPDPLMTGFIDVKMPLGSAKAVGSFIRTELRLLSHWVGFHAFCLPKYVPTFIMRPMIHLQARLQQRTGNFSYMGRWGNEKNPGTAIIGGYPPVTRNQPVAGIGIHWDGRLTLNFILHPFITRDPAVAQKVVTAWRVSLLEEAML